MSFQLTDQQRAAVERRQTPVVLSSGAGCGKTQVLTARYLSHLIDDGSAVSEVLAITFTDQAAMQMRGRIRSELLRRSVAASVDQLPIWQRHLQDLESCSISTIHGFCTELVLEFGHELGLDPSLEVLDASLAGTLRSEAVRQCLDQILTQEKHPIQSDLQQLIILYSWYDVRTAIAQLVQEPDPKAWDRFLQQPPEQTVSEWLEAYHAVNSQRLDLWLNSKSELLKSLEQLNSIRGETPAGIAKRDDVIGQLFGLFDEPERVQDNVSRLRDSLRLGNDWRRLRNEWGEHDYKQMSQPFKKLRQFLEKLEKEPSADREAMLATVAVGQQFVRVARAAYDAYQQLKHDAVRIDFNDQLLFARELLRRDNVRTVFRDRFRFVLCDEFQDTDPVQMEILELLLDQPARESGKLFAVGDQNQSIYSFRGAEVSLFASLRNGVPPQGRLELSQNFRSQPDVLRFVNALFSDQLADYVPLGTPLQASGHGCVEFLWSEPSDPSCKESVEEVRRREADAIAVRILELLRDETPRIRDSQAPGGWRRVELRDITLLFRAMSSVQTYEEALREHQIDYYLIGGKAFFAQQEVYDLLHLIRTIENPRDAASVIGLLRSPFCGLTDDTVTLLALHPEGPFPGLFDDSRLQQVASDMRPAVTLARDFIAEMRRLKDHLTLPQLLNHAFELTGYDAATAFESLADRKLANLWKLVEMSREFDQAGFGLARFAERLASYITEQPDEGQAATRPEEANAVKILSIHKSKGLEFPVVILPDLIRSGSPPNYNSARWHRTLGCLPRLSEYDWDEEHEPLPFSRLPAHVGRLTQELEDWQESQRIFYVAATRAEDLLILSAGLPNPLPDAGLPDFSIGPWLLTLAQHFDLRTGSCLRQDLSAEESPAPIKVTRFIDRNVDLPEGDQADDAAVAYPRQPIPALPKEAAAFSDTELAPDIWPKLLRMAPQLGERLARAQECHFDCELLGEELEPYSVACLFREQTAWQLLGGSNTKPNADDRQRLLALARVATDYFGEPVEPVGWINPQTGTWYRLV